MPNANTKKLSLYERLGEETLERIIYLFYDKVLMDDRISHFFRNVDTRNLARHQHHFMMMATGGPNNYIGRSLRDAHRKLVIEKGLNDSHYDAIKEDLKKTLEELGIGFSTIEEIMNVVENMRPEVLNR